MDFFIISYYRLNYSTVPMPVSKMQVLHRSARIVVLSKVHQRDPKGPPPQLNHHNHKDPRASKTIDSIRLYGHSA